MSDLRFLLFALALAGGIESICIAADADQDSAYDAYWAGARRPVAAPRAGTALPPPQSDFDLQQPPSVITRAPAVSSPRALFTKPTRDAKGSRAAQSAEVRRQTARGGSLTATNSSPPAQPIRPQTTIHDAAVVQASTFSGSAAANEPEPTEDHAAVTQAVASSDVRPNDAMPSGEWTGAEEAPMVESTALDGSGLEVAPLEERKTIYFRPAVMDVNHQGLPVLRPTVRTASNNFVGASVAESSDMHELPLLESEPTIPETWSAPVVEGGCTQCGPTCGPTCQQCSPPRLGPCQELCCRIRARLNGPCSPEPGIGAERVVHAISFIDTTQPQKNFRVRFDAGYDWQAPDRSEYFWAKIGARGPNRPPGAIAERTVDYQDVRFYMEQGGKKFSIGTEIPIRTIDPTVFDNSGGIGDITITTKTLFLDGRTWQIANLFRTYIPSGDASAGLGTGHASIEPGFAWRCKWSDITYIHGDIKYWVPLGGDPVHEGEVLSYGIGVSHVWRDSDSFAIMPTLELVGYTFLDGELTVPGSVVPMTTTAVDSDGILNIHPGIRWVWDKGGDCGVKEFGIFGGFAATSDSLYEELLRAEVRYLW